MVWGALLTFLGFFTYREEYLGVLGGPVWDLLEGGLIYTGFGEVLSGYLWMSLVFSGALSLLLIIVNIYSFLVTALYEAEALLWGKRVALLAFGLPALLFFLHKNFAGALCWYLMGYGGVSGGLAVQFEPRFGEFIGFLLRVDLLLLLVLGGFLLLFLYLYGKKGAVGGFRYGSYLGGALLIVVVVPPDFMLHLILFLGVVTGVELVFFLICWLDEYKCKAIRLVELVDTVDSNSTPKGAGSSPAANKGK